MNNLHFSLERQLHNGDKIAIAAIIISLIAGGLLYNYLPEQVASHWNADGIADGFTNRENLIVGFPILMLLTYLALSLLPKVKELKFEMHLLHKEYASLKAAVLLFMLYVHLVIIYSNTDYALLHVSTPQLIFPGLSILFYYIATLLPQLKRNYLIGIRTPWTIHNDAVWTKTHAVGAKLFKALSVAIMFATLTSSRISTWLVVAPILFVAVFLVVYSYSLHRKLEKQHKLTKKSTKAKKKKR
ncbi:MAG: SdpI family protein [Candidatus Micrarchaeota archaeon]